MTSQTPTTVLTLAAGQTDLSSYLPVFIIILMAISFAVLNIVASAIIGPSQPRPG